MSIEIDLGEARRTTLLRDTIIDHFKSPDLDIVKPTNIRNRANRQPFFVVAGVQVLDDVIHHEDEIPGRRFLVFQPSIRLKFSDRIDLRAPSTTAFINISSLRVNGDAKEHSENTQEWLDFISNIGLGNISTSERKTVSNWGNGNFFNSVTDIYSNNVHIGDAVYRTGIPQQTRGELTISDINFGYERLLNALGINEKMFLNVDISDNTQDLVRTLTLIIGSGNIPTNKSNIGRIIRKLTKAVVDDAPIHDLVYFYYDWWTRFTTLPMKPHRIAEVINDSKFI